MYSGYKRAWGIDKEKVRHETEEFLLSIYAKMWSEEGCVCPKISVN
jgi:hypothetical protein